MLLGSSSSHVPLFGSMRSLTYDSNVCPRGVIIFRSELEGIHGSSHVFTVSPEPILQIKPFLKVSSPFRILCHVKEDPFLCFGFNKSPSAKYLALNILAHKESGFSRRRQACLASNARLKQWISRNPIPPLPLGLVNLSHASQCVFLLSSSSPHQNFLII